MTKTSRAPDSRHAFSICAISSLREEPGASDCATSSAPASTSSPIGRCSSTARIEAWSISSSIEGRSPDRIATTASAATVGLGKVATNVERASCAGTSRSTTRVTIPSVPSLPTKSLSRLSPATSLIRLPPSCTSVPSASTTSRPST